MAEIVGYRQELMLPVYEEMKKRKLCTDTEIREIIKTRESYEYKLNRQTKSIKDFCEYIVYEKSLLAKMAEREKMNNPGKGSDRKFGPVENFIANHIKGIFKQALHLFPEEPRLWESYMKFCTSHHFYVEISNTFEKWLQYHGDDPNVWLRAIKWEFEQTGNMEKVKDLLLRSIQRHPENEALHLEFFKIMLTEAGKMSTELVLENNKISERDIGLKRVEVIYNSSKQKIPNINYLIKILNILEEYPFTLKLQKLVVEDMMNSFPRDEMTWHTFALCELRGMNMSDLFNGTNDNEKNKDNQKQQQQQQQERQQQEKTSPSEGMETITEQTGNGGEVAASETMSESTAATATRSENESIEIEEIDVKPQVKPVKHVERTPKRRIELCCSVYDLGVKTLKTEKMWSMYINTMLELNRDLSTQKALKRQKLAEAFKGAFEQGLLSRTYFESYIELLKESDTKTEIIEEMMKKGTILYPGSVTWELWMEYYIIKDDPQKVYEIFRKATKKLASESFPLWQMLLRYYLTRSDLNQKIDEIFKEAVQFPQSNFLKLRVQYLEWTLITKNIEKTRQLYDEMTKTLTPYYDMHYTMALFESQQLRPDIERWRKCHDNIIYFFGKGRTDVWINYIKFERDHGEVKKMSELHETAKRTLNTDLINKFLSEFSYLTTGIL